MDLILINVLARYNKSFFIRSYKVLSIDLATYAKYLIQLLFIGKIIYIYMSLQEKIPSKRGR